MTHDLASHASRFAIPGRLQLRQGPGGLSFVDIEAEAGSASLCLQGAHLTHFQPRDAAQPLLWVSERTPWAAGQPIRGGIPLCWPWFASHDSDPALPLHGFARTSPWQIVAASCTAGVVELSLALATASPPYWPHAAKLELKLRVADRLELELRTRNSGTQQLRLSEALHAYLWVADVSRVRLHGLDGCRYLDKNDAMRARLQQGPLQPAAAIDRIYLDTTAECWIDDPVLERRIRIAKTGSRSTVVWTPWQERAAAMPDLEPTAWSRVFCVETANAGPNTISLAPGASHTLGASYALA